MLRLGLPVCAIATLALIQASHREKRGKSFQIIRVPRLADVPPTTPIQNPHRV
jgi:hypothetical protein